MTISWCEEAKAKQKWGTIHVCMIATQVLDCVSEHIVRDIRFHCLSVAVQKDILGL